MKYIYQIINIPWVNSTIDVWPDGHPETKTRIKVMGFKGPSGNNNSLLIYAIKEQFNQETVEIQEFTP